MKVTLVPYDNETETAASLIIRFWQAHNYFALTQEAACEDVAEWTKEGHRLYFIRHDAKIAGFVHLSFGARGADSHADIFVIPEFQGMDIDTHAIALAEKILKEQFEALYSGADAAGSKPVRLYQEIGYSCANAAAARKSFRLGRT